VLVFATGSISGGNLNPAVTLSLLLTGKMSRIRALFYVVAQVRPYC
jgi:aquaporin-4